jgi:HPr kinase/phosphorylase
MSAERVPECVYGTCVAIEGAAVLLRGPSGSGKSDLAYRLIDEQGALLVADDQVVLNATKGKLTATACEGWAGLLELRGLGIVSVPHLRSGAIVLVVDLVGRGEVPRLPEREVVALEGVEVLRICLHAFDLSTPAKICLAAKHLPQSGFPGDDGRLG